VPDYSTFSKNRHGRFHESALLRRLFEGLLDSVVRARLFGGEGFATDASAMGRCQPRPQRQRRAHDIR